MKICDSCNLEWPLDRFNPDGPVPDTCFKCRAGSINLGFGGHREHFHSTTDKEAQRKQIAEARANGLDPQPKWNKALPNTGGAAAMKKLEAHFGASKTAEKV